MEVGGCEEDVNMFQIKKLWAYGLSKGWERVPDTGWILFVEIVGQAWACAPHVREGEGTAGIGAKNGLITNSDNDNE